MRVRVSPEVNGYWLRPYNQGLSFANLNQPGYWLRKPALRGHRTAGECPEDDRPRDRRSPPIADERTKKRPRIGGQRGSAGVRYATRRSRPIFLSFTRDRLRSDESDAGIPASVATKKGGANQGSYGRKELVYAYAMWISPKFHLLVIRTFDDLVTGASAHSPSAQQLGLAFAETFAACIKNGISETLAAQVANSATAAATGIQLLDVQSVVPAATGASATPTKAYSAVKEILDLAPGEHTILPAWHRLGYKDEANARNAIYGFARRHGFKASARMLDDGIMVTREGPHFGAHAETQPDDQERLF